MANIKKYDVFVIFYFEPQRLEITFNNCFLHSEKIWFAFFVPKSGQLCVEIIFLPVLILWNYLCTD